MCQTPLTVTLHGRTFEKYISHDRIAEAVGQVAEQLNRDYAHRRPPILLGVLNGAFMFLAELAGRLEFQCEISFVKLASYQGTSSTGCVRELIGLNGDIAGRDVIIVEDIVDTGECIEHLNELLAKSAPSSVEVATLFFKPDSYGKTWPIKYRAMEIENDFIVGYGLDYDNLGRNLRDIYRIVDE